MTFLPRYFKLRVLIVVIENFSTIKYKKQFLGYSIMTWPLHCITQNMISCIKCLQKGIEGERKWTLSNKNDYCYDIGKSEMKRMSCRLWTKCNDVVLHNSVGVYAWIKCKHEKVLNSNRLAKCQFEFFVRCKFCK